MGGKEMEYIMIGVALAAFAMGGPIMAVMCGVGGIAYIVYLMFKTGPKLTLIAIPTVICVFLCSLVEDLIWMYFRHVLIFALICPVVTAIICNYVYGEGYKRIVIGVTAGFAAVTMALLAAWLYIPRELKVPDRTAKVEIQDIDESKQAVYTDSVELENLLERLDGTRMRGSFEELVDQKITDDTYCLTLFDEKGKELGTYYFFNRYNMAKRVGPLYLYYRWTEESQFPYELIGALYENAVAADE